ncbi:PilZ domain-containing protein [Sphingomonas sp. URHD0057]|uniref:PilZ domain-containing protein n=1 Tax=Sphingomonas sp. URHD0057 TaxID=1380389 RepID=UPI003FA70EC6
MNERAPRVDLRRSGVLIDSDGIESEVTILDVSRGGLRLVVSEGLRIGELATLRVEHGEAFPVEIRWLLGNEAGAVFLTPVDFAEWVRQGQGGPVP